MDRDFEEQLEKFNSFYSAAGDWKPTQARKKHEDEFGNNIEIGDVYFKKSICRFSNYDLKLSKKSIDVLFGLLFEEPSSFNALGEELAKERRKEFRDSIMNAKSKMKDIDF